MSKKSETSFGMVLFIIAIAIAGLYFLSSYQKDGGFGGNASAALEKLIPHRSTDSLTSSDRNELNSLLDSVGEDLTEQNSERKY